MRIKTSLISLVFILIVFIITFSSKNLYEANNNYKDIKFVEKASPIIDGLLSAAGNWAVERGVTNAALAYPDIPPKKMFDNIEMRIKNSDLEYKYSLEKLKEIDFEGKSDLIKDLEKKYEIISDMRIKAQKNMNLKPSDRDASFISSWVPSMSKMILSSQALRFSLGVAFGKIDSPLYSQTQTKHFSWVMSEYAGRERAIIGGIIASKKPITFEKHGILSSYNGRVKNAWDSVLKLNKDNKYNKVLSAIDNANKNYFGSFEVIRKNIYEEGINGRPYTISANEWIKESTNAIDTILNIQNSSIEETKIYIKNLKDNVMSKLYLNSILILLSFVIALISYYIIFKKILNPINSISFSMVKLSEGDLDAEIPYINEKNEIGDMSRSVEIFKKNANKQKKLEKDNLLRKEKEEEEKFKIIQAQEKNILSELSSLLDASKEGDYSVRLNTDDKKGLILTLSESMNQINYVFMDGIINVKTLIEKLSNGDLTDKMSGSQKGIFKEIQKSLNTTIESLSSMINRIKNNAHVMQDQSRKITEKSSQVLENTVFQMDSIEKTIEKMCSIQEASKNNLNISLDTNNISVKAMEISEKSINVIEGVENSMMNIKKSSEDIVKIINVIDEIAFQTNLLSLNASVEAASAGENGKGFSVVAEEVRSLARRSAKSSKDIKEIIHKSSLHITKGVDNVNEASRSFKKIHEAIMHSLDQTKIICDESRRQAEDIKEINKSLEDIGLKTKNNVETATESKNFANKISDISVSLRRDVDYFSIVDEKKDTLQPKLNA